MQEVSAAGQRQPRCRHFGQCGVCTLQLSEYPRQLALKTQESKRFISESLAIDPAIVWECVPSTEEYAFLTSLDLTASYSDSGLALGLPSQEPSTVLPIARCELLPREVQTMPRSISGALRYISNARDDLAVQMARIRRSNSGGLELSLWTPPGPFPRQIASSTLVSSTGCKGLRRIIFRGAPSSEDIVVVEDLVSKIPWTMCMAGHQLQASAVSPIPPNTGVAEAMIHKTFELGWLSDRSIVLELYPGIGSFTVPIAETVKAVTALEPFAYAYHDLVANLARSKTAAKPVPGSIPRALPQIREIDSIVLHADRSNLTASDWKTLGGSGASTLILIAHEIGGLVRSADNIAGVGFIPTEVIPFDIRPQTMDTAFLVRFLKE